jgi:diaminopimelate epimerase
MKFAKYEGAGNDFILIDDRNEEFLIGKELIQTLCHRRFGIGADGLILLRKDPSADVRMRIFNRDGSEAEGCGNGVRCLMQFCIDLGFPLKKTTIALSDRILIAERLEEGVSVQMGEMRGMRLHLSVDDHQIHFVDSGVPHAVSFVENIESFPVDQLGREIRFHSCFAPAGANVNFAQLQEDGVVRVRTYERGVEGETLACGTGAVAVAALGAKLFGWKSPVAIKASGGALFVHFDSEFKNMFLVGQARRVFWGGFSLKDIFK